MQCILQKFQHSEHQDLFRKLIVLEPKKHTNRFPICIEIHLNADRRNKGLQKDERGGKRGQTLPIDITPKERTERSGLEPLVSNSLEFSTKSLTTETTAPGSSEGIASELPDGGFAKGEGRRLKGEACG